MSNQSFEHWEERVRSTGTALPYPPTPDVAGAVARRLAVEPERRQSRRQRWALVAGVVALVLAGLLAVPPVRAAVLEFFRIGNVRIFPYEPTFLSTVPASSPTAASPLTAPSATASGAPARATVRSSSTPTPTQVPTPTPRQDVGISLAEARRQVDFRIRLPAYPPGLGPPDRVFVERLDGPLLVLVWLDKQDPDRPRFVVYELGSRVLIDKYTESIQKTRETEVNGQRAVWGEGPHFLAMIRGDEALRWRRVESSALVWTGNGLTYRLETDLPFAEAVKIAESVR